MGGKCAPLFSSFIKTVARPFLLQWRARWTGILHPLIRRRLWAYLTVGVNGLEKKLEFLASDAQTECPVCLEDFDLMTDPPTLRTPETLGCCHKVCKECWLHWSSVMHGNPFCPLCRHDEFLGAVASHVVL